MRGLIVAGLGMLALAGCSSTSNLPPTNCPRITILQDGADLTRFVPGSGQDLTVMVADARIRGLNARCDYGRGGRSVDAQLTVSFEVERGPAARGPVSLPWFVIVTDAADENIIQRRAYEMVVAFPANVSRSTTTAPPVRMSFPISEGRRITDYNVRVAFQLDPDELAYNRRRGVR